MQSYARRSLIPGETAFDLDDRRFVVDQVDLDSQRVSLRDVTFAEATGFPIFRSEPIWVIRQYLEQEAAPAKPEKPLTVEKRDRYPGRKQQLFRDLSGKGVSPVLQDQRGAGHAGLHRLTAR